eukprot:m.1287341 g.1287341  ORF g.1287341 m.1287341 type:complete len:747 (-) comp24781_c0_seq15:3930-6170(-)
MISIRHAAWVWALLLVSIVNGITQGSRIPSIEVDFSEAAPKLAPSKLLRLPVGATLPQGWLSRELELQANGITGQLPYFWHFINDSSWMGGRGNGGGAGEQYVPYFLNGLIPLSFQTRNENLERLRERYVSYVLGQQNISTNGTGWLGPPIPWIPSFVPDGEVDELFTKYDMVEALESYAEANATAAASVVRALMAHHKQMYAQLSSKRPALNFTKWGFMRCSDAVVGIQWLLDRGEEAPWLWDLLQLIMTQSEAAMQDISAADGGGFTWQEWFRFGDPFAYANDHEATGAVHLRRHGVDIGQAMKTGGLWWRANGKHTDLQSPFEALAWAEKYLHMADGMYFADEEVTSKGSGPQPLGNRSGGHTAGRGTETCSVVETMFSMRMAYEITGNITFMDRLERLAFNALPAALWPDITANVYHHRSNQITCSGQYGYNLFFCCSSNVHQGWPKFLLSSVHTRTNGTIVISGYAPTETTMPGSNTTVTVGGKYPFADTATVYVSQPADMQLRIPCWSDNATVSLNGRILGVANGCTFYGVTVTAPQSTITVLFGNTIKLYTWKRNTVDGSYTSPSNGSPPGPQGGGIEVHRGALTYALRPASIVTETTIGCIGGKPEGRFGWNCSSTPGGKPQYPDIKSRDVTCETDPAVGNGNWSYAILPGSLRFVPMAPGSDIPKIPFSVTEQPAVKIVVSAKNLNSKNTVWQDPGIPPHSPLSSDAPWEQIDLVPFGSTNIRISVFPSLDAKQPTT